MNGDPRFSNKCPPYIEPPNSASSQNDSVSLQQAYNNLTHQYDRCQRANENLHNKLSQLSVQMTSLREGSGYNAQQNIALREENDRLRSMLEQNQTKLPQTEVNKRLRNLEEFCYRLSERDIERFDKISNGVSLSNISCGSNEPIPLQYKDACSTSEYSSHCSLDRLDGHSLKERLIELESTAFKQDAKIRILERSLQEKNSLIRRLRSEVEQTKQLQGREFTQI